MFDEHASALLPALAGRFHVWLVDSAENTKAAQGHWERASPVKGQLTSGVTTFVRQDGWPEEALDIALELVEDHHGEHAHDPPVDEVLVLGIEATEAVFGVLREWGFTEIRSSAGGLLGQRG